MDGFHTLIIVVFDTVELLIEDGQLGVIFLCFLINLHYLKFSIENTGKDKFGLVLHSGLLEHCEQLFVLTIIKTEVIAVHAWIGE